MLGIKIQTYVLTCFF